MKTIILALAFIAALATPALSQATCDLYYQYDYSKTIVQGLTQSESMETYIIEGMEEVDAFINEVNAKTGSTIPLGTADALLAFTDSAGTTLLIFGYKDGCQIGHTKVPWVPS